MAWAVWVILSHLFASGCTVASSHLPGPVQTGTLVSHVAQRASHPIVVGEAFRCFLVEGLYQCYYSLACDYVIDGDCPRCSTYTVSLPADSRPYECMNRFCFELDGAAMCFYNDWQPDEYGPRGCLSASPECYITDDRLFCSDHGEDIDLGPSGGAASNLRCVAARSMACFLDGGSVWCVHLHLPQDRRWVPLPGQIVDFAGAGGMWCALTETATVECWHFTDRSVQTLVHGEVDALDGAESILVTYSEICGIVAGDAHCVSTDDVRSGHYRAPARVVAGISEAAFYMGVTCVRSRGQYSCNHEPQLSNGQVRSLTGPESSRDAEVCRVDSPTAR